MRLPSVSTLAIATIVAGTGLFLASLDTVKLSFADRLSFRLGFVLLIVGATVVVAVRIRRLTPSDIERARQQGYDEGRADAFAVQPQLIDLDLARTALTERRAAQQLAE